MTKEEMDTLWYQIRSISRQAAFVPLASYEELGRANDHAHAIGPLMDPTFYRDKGDDIDLRTRLLQAFLAFRREIEQIRAEEIQSKGGG